MVEVLDKLKLDRIRFLIRKKKEEVITKELPMHIAFSMHGYKKWAEDNKVEIAEGIERSFLILRNTIKIGISLNIPISTFHILGTDIMKEESERFIIFMDKLVDFFERMREDETVHKNRVKISVWGKWYDLPGRVVEPIKKVLDETADYDNFFVNLCINYDGQEEIVDSTRLMAMQIISHKIGVDSINKELMKENLYSSYFLPPDLIIKTGNKKIPNLLLWDSINSQIYFSDKLWPDFDRAELNRALEQWKRNR